MTQYVLCLFVSYPLDSLDFPGYSKCYKRLHDISDYMSLSFKYFDNNIYLPDQSDSELSADFIRMVTVRSPERTSGSEKL